MKPTSSKSGFDQALQLHQQGRLAEAEALYRRVLRGAPTHFDALHLLGVVCGQTDRLDEALGLLNRALAQRPGSAPALNNLGNTLAQAGRHDDAVAAFNRALGLRPDDAKALRNRGTSLRALGRNPEALASLDAALALRPDYAEAIIGRAELLLALQRRDEAVEAFRRALPLGVNTELIRYALASLGDEPVPGTAPAGYVQALFDGYAANFDQHLVENLAYRAPDLLAQALADAAPPSGGRVIDLGCGTGLCGPHLRPLAQHLVGVDLSGAMLAKAREAGGYDELVQGDIVAALRGQAQPFDIVVAADVFVYIGDLAEVFSAVWAALRPGGVFAFSVEAHEAGQGDYVLGPTRRYAHALAYLQRLAAAQGLAVHSTRQAVLRQQGTQAVQGHLLVMRRPS
jgi:predicted TPR repeat methyltransferase